MSASNLPGPASGPHGNHGLYVKAANGLRLRDRRVQRLVRKMRVAMPWLEEVDLPAARAWAQFEVLADQVYAWLRASSVVNAKGEGKRLLHDFRQLRQTQLEFARQLGMTPASRAALKASRDNGAFDLASVIADDAADGAIAVSELRKRPASESKANNASDGGDDAEPS